MSNISNTDASTVASDEIDPLVRRRSRIKLVSIFAIFAIPLILASVYLHLLRANGGSLGITSRGQLISPAVPLTEFALEQQDGDFNLDSVRGIWTMLYVSSTPCEDTCKTNLYHMRQVRLLLNHRMNRVQRAVLVAGASPIQAAVLDEHPGLIVAAGDSSEVLGLVRQIADAQQAMEPLPEAIYLIDPFGNLMLRFAPDLDPGKMLKDIKHLLKVSRIG